MRANELTSKTLYHVTLSKRVPSIKKKGLLPLQPSNWVKAGDKSRYGEGELFAFSDKKDAIRWAAKMDWEFNKTMGSGNVSIITFTDNHDWDIDDADPIAQAGKSGSFLKRRGKVDADQITGIEPFTVDLMRAIMAS